MIKNSLLWELNKGGFPKSYVFGTMHVQDKKAFAHWEKAQIALAQCSSFCTEINLEQAQGEISTDDYLLPDGMTISGIVSEKQFLKMSQILLHAFDFELNQWDRYLPMIIVNRIAENLLSKDNARSLDGQLWTEAKRLKLECDGLETLNEQLSLLKSLDINEQMQQLKALCRNVSKFRKTITKTTDIYVTEDITRLYKYTKKSLGKFRSSLLYDRNKLMAERIGMRVEQNTFYAVGAAHLAGRYGVLPFLKRAGFRVKPL